MESYLDNQELAVVLAEIRTSSTATERTANKLIKNFLPAIEQLASTYPKFWEKDFVQEGKIALLRAAQKYPVAKNVGDFFKYAYTAIKNHLLNFYYAVIKRQPETVELILDEDEDESQDKRLGYSDDYNIVINCEQAIDFRLLLTEEGLGKAGFKTKEIRAFRLYFIEDYTLADVAAQLEISDTQASRLMNRVRDYIKEILN
jgi:RNA polymerase sigma factor (sigma-70 family)